MLSWKIKSERRLTDERNLQQCLYLYLYLAMRQQCTQPSCYKTPPSHDPIWMQTPIWPTNPRWPRNTTGPTRFIWKCNFWSHNFKSFPDIFKIFPFYIKFWFFVVVENVFLQLIFSIIMFKFLHLKKKIVIQFIWIFWN